MYRTGYYAMDTFGQGAPVLMYASDCGRLIAPESYFFDFGASLYHLQRVLLVCQNLAQVGKGRNILHVGWPNRDGSEP